MGENVTSKQKIALLSLLTSGDVPTAAKAAGVTPKTVYAWLRLEMFRYELNRLEDETTRDAVRRLAGLQGKAVGELETLLNSSKLAPSDKIKAIRTALDSYPRLREFTDLAERLARMEDALKNVTHE